MIPGDEFNDDDFQDDDSDFEDETLDPGTDDEDEEVFPGIILDRLPYLKYHRYPGGE